MIVNQYGKKLSKRDGSLMQFIEQYRNQGYLPEALFNFISLLGWSSHQEREIYTKEELISIFNSDYFSKAPSMFDLRKLLWMNNHYIKNLKQEQYLNFVRPFVEKEYQWKEKMQDWWIELLLIYQKQLMYGQEINQLIKLFFNEAQEPTKEAQEFLKANYDAATAVVVCFKKELNKNDEWTVEAIENMIKQVKSETKISGKPLFMSIRIACSYSMQGPELAKTIKLLGREEVLSRINNLKL